jgi:hypothetical protein
MRIRIPNPGHNFDLFMLKWEIFLRSYKISEFAQKSTTNTPTEHQTLVKQSGTGTVKDRLPISIQIRIRNTAYWYLLYKNI